MENINIKCPSCEESYIGYIENGIYVYYGIACKCGFMNKEMKEQEKVFKRALYNIKAERKAKRLSKEKFKNNMDGKHNINIKKRR